MILVNCLMCQNIYCKIIFDRRWSKATACAVLRDRYSGMDIICDHMFSIGYRKLICPYVCWYFKHTTSQAVNPMKRTRKDRIRFIRVHTDNRYFFPVLMHLRRLEMGGKSHLSGHSTVRDAFGQILHWLRYSLDLQWWCIKYSLALTIRGGPGFTHWDSDRLPRLIR